MPDDETKPKTRSGARWTEAQIAAAGYEQLHLRVKKGTKAKLRELAADSGFSMSDMAEAMVDRAHAEMLQLRRT